MRIPEEIRRVTGDTGWSDDTEGLSRDIWRVGGSYVKRNAADEHERLLWLVLCS